jgi:hypothetical protein
VRRLQPAGRGGTLILIRPTPAFDLPPAPTPPDPTASTHTMPHLPRFAHGLVAAACVLSVASVGRAEPPDANRTEARQFWSFRPVKRPAIPAVKDSTWPLNPVDRFVRAEQERKGLLPVGDADRRTLIRRVTFDLTGLPPTPEEIEAFEKDESPDAHEKLIDRLLASPHYGERWGRHWLDVVRYADTAGNAPDFPVPQAHLYRDWVIEAFNDDTPYDRFLREQVAGDLISKEAIVATGYLAIHRRFGGTGSPDHLEVEDLIDNLGRGVLGLSLACARCHDHKFDPVSQEDYYALAGIFQSTRFPFPGTEGMAKQQHFVTLGKGRDAYAVGEGKPTDAKIHKGGDPGRLGDAVLRGFPAILGGQTLPKEEMGSGRKQLAEWLTDPKNPLTARVMVNRIWLHLFGRGLVVTPNDFGTRGKPPTHPELLDYLASEFVEKKWSVKSLVRLIVLSRTYRLASVGRPEQAKTDPDNAFLWKHERRRLDAESIRDALLAVGGGLDRDSPGPHPFPKPESWNFSQHAPFEAVYESNRRSVYLMQQRLKRHPFLALFDGPDPNASTARRDHTTTPVQALFWVNDPFVHRQAERLAARVLKAGEKDIDRLTHLFRLALGRPPTGDETAQATEYLKQFAGGLDKSGVPTEERPAKAWASLARVVFATNEFLYID